jgi:hypothetical protein
LNNAALNGKTPMDGLPEKMFSKFTNGLASAADAIDIFAARMHEWLQQITIHAGLAWKIFIADINSVVALLKQPASMFVVKISWFNQLFEAPHIQILVALIASSALFFWLLNKRNRSFDRQNLPDSEDHLATFDRVSRDAARDKQMQHERSSEQHQFGSLEANNHQSKPSSHQTNSGGFRFFKKSRADEEHKHVKQEDDIFLLGLEQEMLATRQLYLDGFISKQVYVNETKSLYQKAKSRMT